MGTGKNLGRTLVLGGGYAGVLAAIRLGHRIGALGGDVVLVDESSAFVERIRFHQMAAGRVLRQWRYDTWLQPAHVKFTQARILEIDIPRARVRIEAPDGVEDEVAYDMLIYCLGSREEALPPALAEGGARVHSISSMAGTARLRDALAQRPSDAVLVCGGGATGVELAFELAQSGKRVTLASTGPVAASLGSEASAYVERSLAARGVVVKQGRVGRFEAGRARFDDGEEVACDWLVWAGGFAVSPLARAAGLDVDARGRVRVDATQRSLSHPMVWAAGDAASMACRTDVRMGCATAMPQGAHAGESVAREMLGLPATPLRYGYSVSCLSLGTDDGVFVRLHADGSPTGRPITGRAGRLLKESVMRYTRVGLQLERRFPGAYWWSAGAKTPVGIG